jgi:hypothetical protein
MWAAGCSDDKPTGPGAAAFVVRGTVSSSGSPVKDAVVQAETGAATESSTTDSLGAYLLLFDALPDSVRVCVAATNYVDTCIDALNPPDTLILNWPMHKVPPKDTIWLSVDTVAAGDTAEVILYLSNPDSAIAGMNVWLEWPSSDIRYDTVQLSASRIPPGMDWSTGRHDSISNVAILAFDIDGVATISPGRGPLMTIRFAVEPVQPAGFVPIDTSTRISPFIQRVSLSYPSGGKAIIPAFLPGGIEVQ